MTARDNGRRGVAILGSTGSVGTTALRVIDRHPHRFRVAALTAFSNEAALAEQVSRYAPAFSGLAAAGTSCLVEAAQRDDFTLVAVRRA